jgi:hypothetical protein
VAQLQCVPRVAEPQGFITTRVVLPGVQRRRPSEGMSLVDACGRSDASAVQGLLDGSADPNQVDQDGRAPLIVACANGWEEVARVRVRARARVRWCLSPTPSPPLPLSHSLPGLALILSLSLRRPLPQP